VQAADVADEATAELLEHPASLQQLAPEAIGVVGVIGRVLLVAPERIARSTSTGLVQIATSMPSSRRAATVIA
jgi:hypothetical protein